LNLLELMLGYDRLIVVDAILTESGEVGEIYRLKPEQVCKPSNSSISPHHFNLATTLAIGKKLFPDEMPSEVTVFAVNTEDATIVTDEMTDKVRDAIPRVVSLVSEELKAA
jgi:hydrogenase maturation protease